MSKQSLTLGVISTSNKENEHRVPIHPAHFGQIDAPLKKRIFFQKGYGLPFQLQDKELSKTFAGTLRREELFERCDIILIPKPTDADFPYFRKGQILWGWPHCVQGRSITQVGIDKRLTYIAFESMFSWKNGSVRDLHTFHKNNEMAGYCSVLQALQLAGMTGHYGAPLKAAVLSFGSTGRGALHALMGMGITDITVFARRQSHGLTAPIPSLRYRRYASGGGGKTVALRDDGSRVPFAQELADYDIIVNCILQDPNNPLMYIRGKEIERLKPGAVIVDVSCDKGMGFDFARPTSFEAPSFDVGNGIMYYAVDHSPTYLWKSASFEISTALLPYLKTVMSGPAAWKKVPVVWKAIDIDKGVLKNPDIAVFQKRTAQECGPATGRPKAFRRPSPRPALNSG